jgi:hypothetical protein
MKIISLCILLMFTHLVKAEDNPILTLAELKQQGFVLIQSGEMSEMLLDKTVLIKDLLSKSVYEVKINKDGSTDKKQIKKSSAKILTSIEYHSRPALLDATTKFSISHDKIISTDGVRTYISSLYKKQDKIYAVRDVDHNRVSFQIIIPEN